MKHFKTEMNPVTGAREDYYWDDNEQKLTVRNRHEVGDILDGNKRDQARSVDHRFGGEMMHRMAEIPMAVVVQWKQKYGVDIFSSDPWHKKRVRQLLNDPEWRYLRTNTRKL